MLDLNNVTSGYSTNVINNNFSEVERYINENLLNRDGVNPGEPNQMEVDLDMNSRDILNVEKISARTLEVNGTDLQSKIDEAERFAEEAKEALELTREVSDKFGDVDSIVEEATLAKDSAEDSAVRSEASAAESSAQVVLAEQEAGRAESEADRAEAASNAAYASGHQYTNTSQGLSATINGQYFLVRTADPQSFIVFLNDNGTAVNSGTFTVAGAETTKNAKRARIEIVGRVSEISYSALGRPIITISEEGSIFIENNSGLRFAAIAPLPEPVELAANNGLVVDLDGETDALGRYIPVVENIASGGSVGWQSRNKFVLIAAGGESGNTSRWLSGVYDRSFAEANRVALNSVRAREEITGTYVVERVQTFSTRRISLKEGFVYREGGAVQIIAPVAAAAVTPGRGWTIDTEVGPFDEYGRIIPQLVTLSSASGWTTGTKHVICGVASRGADGGPAADRYVNLIGAYRPTMAGPYDGEVAWNQSASTPLPEWDASTRTLSWSNLFMMISGLQSRVLLNAGAIVIPDGGFWVALLDTTAIDFTSASPTIPATSVVARTYGSGTGTTSWAAEPGRFIPLFVVGYNATYPVRFPPVRGSTTYPSAGGGGKPDGLLVVVSGGGEVRIYQPGSNPNSDGAVETVYTHSVNPDVGADVWRINGIYAATRTGTTTSRVRTICQTGEIEMAILINGKSDHIGGAAHGDEIKEYVTMLINGVDTPLDVAGTFECKTVEFLQKSKLFEPDTTVPQSNHIATSWKRVAFHVDHAEINNRIEWLQSFTLDQAFLSMLTALRDASGGEPIKITTEGFRSPYWESEDISEIGHPRIETPAGLIKLSGPSGYGMEMEILGGWDKPNRRAYIASTAQYNKLYFDFVGNGYVTEPGEVMEARSRFRIQNSN